MSTTPAKRKKPATNAADLSPTYGLQASMLLFAELETKEDRLLTLQLLWRLVPARVRMAPRLAAARAFEPAGGVR